MSETNKAAVEVMAAGIARHHGTLPTSYERKHAQAALAALEAAGLVIGQGWQPIETAPRDGSWFMAVVGDTIQPICWINDTSDYEPYTGWAYADCRWGGVLYEGYNELSSEPTHWMPIPAPPMIAAAKGEG